MDPLPLRVVNHNARQDVAESVTNDETSGRPVAGNDRFAPQTRDFTGRQPSRYRQISAGTVLAPLYFKAAAYV